MTTDNPDSGTFPCLSEIDDVVYDAVRVETLLEILSDFSTTGSEVLPQVQTMIALCRDMAKALVNRIDALPRVKQ